MPKTDDAAVGIDPAAQKDKRKDAEERLTESREAGRVRSFDRDDKFLGWDAQQGVLPERGPEDAETFEERHRPESLYAEDPVVYREDQLPDPEALKAAGLAPVLGEDRVAVTKGKKADRREATVQDGGPQTANIVDEEATEPDEVETDDDKKSGRKKSTGKK